ncbi:MAG TPA: hypothetical protein VNQ90_02325 [Chthoniobacteraceae bacterium]|nr:hypothetical protein [Chthoniobacteraceae bacterium]
MKPYLLLLLAIVTLGTRPALADELEAKVPYLADIASAGWDFDAPPWKKAGRVDHLAKMGAVTMLGVSFHEEARQPTTIHLARDRDALYFGFDCADPDAKNLEKSGAATESEGFPEGDRIELYLEGDQASRQAYYHLAFNVAGARYRALQHNRVETGSWSVRTRFLKDRWQAIVRIPYADIGLDPAQAEMRGMFYRMYRPDDRENGREQTTWGGRGVHQWSALGLLKLEPIP